jgi:hypothetical protein
MKELSLEEVTKRYLDNADLKIRVSENMQRIDLEFLVFGKVDDGFWKVVFTCERVLSFQFSQEENDEAEDSGFFVLNTEVKEKILSISEPKNPLPGQTGQPAWEVSASGNVAVHVACLDFKWQLISLDEKEYYNAYE